MSDTKCCCEALTQALGKGDRPTPAYISPVDWNSGRARAGWYPGADGPGYYFIHDLEETEEVPTPEGVFVVPKIEYRRMTECPFCGAPKKRPRGRRPKWGKAVSISLTLYPHQIEFLDREGNISAAIQALVNEAMAREQAGEGGHSNDYGS